MERTENENLPVFGRLSGKSTLLLRSSSVDFPTARSATIRNNSWTPSKNSRDVLDSRRRGQVLFCQMLRIDSYFCTFCGQRSPGSCFEVRHVGKYWYVMNVGDQQIAVPRPVNEMSTPTSRPFNHENGPTRMKQQGNAHRTTTTRHLCRATNTSTSTLRHR